MRILLIGKTVPVLEFFGNNIFDDGRQNKTNKYYVPIVRAGRSSATRHGSTGTSDLCAHSLPRDANI